MIRPNTATAGTVTLAGKTFIGWVRSNVGSGQQATQFSALYMNALQESIIAIIEEAGLTVPDASNIDLDILVKAIRVISGSRLYGDIFLVDTSVQDAYLTKHGLVRLDGQTLAKTTYPKLYNEVVATYHKNNANLNVLSLAQSLRLAPKATTTGVELPDIDISKTQARSEYNEQGSFVAWNLFGTPTKATRSNLIMWNRDRNRLAYVKDALTTGATLVEVDLNNWTTPNTDWVVSGIGGQALNWRQLMYDTVTRNYILTKDGGTNDLEEFHIEASTKNATYFGYSGKSKLGNLINSNSWHVTDGWKRNTFNGEVHDYADRTDDTSNFYFHATDPVFATGESTFIAHNQLGYANNFLGARHVNYRITNNMDYDHSVLYTDDNNWMAIFWEANPGRFVAHFMIEGIYRYEDYSALHVLGACQNEDAYFILVAGIAGPNAPQKYTGIHAYSKRRIGDPRMCIQT